VNAIVKMGETAKSSPCGLNSYACPITFGPTVLAAIVLGSVVAVIVSVVGDGRAPGGTCREEPSGIVSVPPDGPMTAYTLAEFDLLAHPVWMLPARPRRAVPRATRFGRVVLGISMEPSGS
jgi:hypothetical protein